MTQKAKTPKLAFRVLHVTGAGRKIVKVQPKGQSITIGSDTWHYSARDHRWPGKGKWDAVAVEGRDACLSPWEPTTLTSAGYNADVENNLLEQVHALARGGKTERISWVNLGFSFLLFVAVIGMGMKISGDIADHDADVRQLMASMGGQTDDRTIVGGQPQTNPGPQSLGSVQQSQQDPGGG